jgi:hypothetical protein
MIWVVIDVVCELVDKKVLMLGMILELCGLMCYSFVGWGGDMGGVGGGDSNV